MTAWVAAALPPGPLGIVPTTAGVDPALVWADATGWRDALRPGQGLPAMVAIAAERAAGGSYAALQALGAVLPPAHGAAAAVHLAASVPRTAVPALLAPGSPLARFELALPAAAPAPAGSIAETTAGAVLLGVIDHGCPFAHQLLRDTAGTGTRVLRIWDQEAQAPCFVGVGGVLPAPMGYGAEIGRTALNALMAAAARPGRSGAVDEDRCYALAGSAAPLQERFGHGAGVTTLLAASRRPGERQGPGDAAAGADLVFVQIPRDAVQDSSSGALPRYVIDGLRWIAGCAKPKQRVVVVLADGSSRTLHDGSSLVEQAMAELVSSLQAQDITLQVVVAAGNSGDEERHALLGPASAATALRRVLLRVPPDNESPCFVTLRLPAPGQQLRITAPGGVGVQLGAGAAWGWTRAGDPAPAAGVVIATPQGGNAAQGLLVVAATRRGSGAAAGIAAPGGDWLIERIDDETAAPPVQAWVSRGQRNAGALPRSRQARFVDVDRLYDPQPQRRCSELDALPPASAMRRAGSLNGVACLPPGQGLVAIGSALQREQRAPGYASAGPAAGTRGGPDCAAAADFARCQLGRLVHGNRSGVATRATGSSFAAPRRARQLAQAVPPALVAPPVADPARLGAGIAPP